jgi:hypothetical protein
MMRLLPFALDYWCLAGIGGRESGDSILNSDAEISNVSPEFRPSVVNGLTGSK